MDRGGPIAWTFLLSARSPPASTASPPAGRNPARLTVASRSGSATYPAPIGARVTLAPSSPSGATGLAATDGTGVADPNTSSTVMPSAWASASAVRRDGSD